MEKLDPKPKRPPLQEPAKRVEPSWRIEEAAASGECRGECGQVFELVSGLLFPFWCS
jgi:hypothetical protein